jgi:hypothetical protein
VRPDFSKGEAVVDRTALALLGGAAVLLTGCSAAHEPVVEDVATTFEDPDADPEARCELLAPATREAFEHSEGASCSDAVQELPLDGGTVESIEIWGGEAQVRLTGDTIFLTETSLGWRITAAVCQKRAEEPYECEVDGP